LRFDRHEVGKGKEKETGVATPCKTAARIVGFAWEAPAVRNTALAWRLLDALPMNPTLSYVNVFAADIVALSGFYQGVFGFAEIEEIRSPIFRGLDTGKSSLGFNAHDAYELLQLAHLKDAKGIKFLLNFDVASKQEVDRLVPIAQGHGATLVKAPYETYYHWYQAVLLDPEGNVFRINHML
jgi:catechol 2,3-dioxygenase-like lactoylglutathione lyase family enzyme